MTDLISLALEFAREKHKKQTRKFENTPYIEHPIGVVNILSDFTNDEAIICAAYLHDTIEDTNTNLLELKTMFNQEIASLVEELTSHKKDQEKIGKPQYLSRKLNGMSEKAKMIKFADRLHNVSNIGKGPINFSRRYAQETAFILNNISFKPNKIYEQLIGKIWEKINPILAK